MSDPGPVEETGVGSSLPRSRIGRVLLIGALSLVALLCIALAALVYTRPGQQIVLEQALQRVSAQLGADVSVSEIGSAGLLSGVTLSGHHR